MNDQQRREIRQAFWAGLAGEELPEEGRSNPVRALVREGWLAGLEAPIGCARKEWRSGQTPEGSERTAG